jgi:hypothetical protein
MADSLALICLTSGPTAVPAIGGWLRSRPGGATKKHIHLYDAVLLPYESVRKLLRHHADEVLQVPLDQSVAGVHETTTALEFPVAGMSIAKEVLLHVGEYTDLAGRIPMGRLQLRWEPSDHSVLFPMIEADLEVEPIDHERTMVSLLGLYQPPLGRFGEAVDRIVLHRLAEAAFQRFFRHLLHEIVADAARLERPVATDEARPSRLKGTTGSS